MKKKRNIIICVILILIVVLIASWYELCQYESYTGVINSINNTSIGIITSNGRYIFSIENVSCKDNEGKRIEVTDLKEGDTIKVINRKGAMIGIYPTHLPDVKSVQLLGSNLQTFSENLSFISLDDSKEILLSDIEWLDLLRWLDRVGNEDEIIEELPLEKDYQYIPKGNSNYQYQGGLDDTIIEVYDSEIHIIKNLITQTVMKIDDERFNQFIELLDKFRKET